MATGGARSSELGAPHAARRKACSWLTALARAMGTGGARSSEARVRSGSLWWGKEQRSCGFPTGGSGLKSPRLVLNSEEQRRDTLCEASGLASPLHRWP